MCMCMRACVCVWGGGGEVGVCMRESKADVDNPISWELLWIHSTRRLDCITDVISVVADLASCKLIVISQQLLMTTTHFSAQN